MNHEIALKWAEALESGRYSQGRGVLRRGRSFCCLGVLCDLSKIGEWRIVDGHWIYHVGQTGTERYPARGVIEWAGLDREPTQLPTGVTLSSMNDGGASFTEIASFIRKNWELL